MQIFKVVDLGSFAWSRVSAGTHGKILSTCASNQQMKPTRKRHRGIRPRVSKRARSIAVLRANKKEAFCNLPSSCCILIDGEPEYKNQVGKEYRNDTLVYCQSSTSSSPLCADILPEPCANSHDRTQVSTLAEILVKLFLGPAD